MKKIIISVVLVVLVLIGGFYFLKSKNILSLSSSKDTQVVENCKTLIGTDWNAGFQCVLDLGKTISDALSCDTLADASKEKYRESEVKKQSQDLVAMCKAAVATEQKNAQICMTINSFSDEATAIFRNTCLIQVATLTKDAKVCDGITTDLGRNLCVANTKEGLQKCLAIKDADFQNQCLVTLATHNKDVSVCNDIILSGKGGTAQGMKNGCILSVAQQAKDWKICRTIDATGIYRDWIGYCVFQTVYLNKLDRSLCENAGTYKDKCYANFDIPPASINIPTKSKLIIRRGEKYTLKWSAQEAPSTMQYVSLVLTNTTYPNKIQKDIFSDISNDGMKAWLVPQDLPVSDGYTLTARACSRPTTPQSLPECYSFGDTPLSIQ